MLRPFENEPYSDFTDSHLRAEFEAALGKVEDRLGEHALLVIGPDRIGTKGSFESIDPAEPARVVGVASLAEAEHVDRALEAAWKAFPGWSGRTAEERAGLVHRIGDLMAERKYELAAWQVFEAGKNWTEAEADVAEAIDFCRYYAHQALAMAEPVPVHQRPGEVNRSWLQPLGAGVVIPPWNFPLAILVGMTIGPVAAGNTVVLKPASNTPIVGWGFMKILEEAGMPPGVVNFLPGPGATVGDALVDHPRTRFVNFTGSKEVGLRIAERAGIVHPGQVWLKRAYMEMGGKDAMIVDETADLEAAADDVIRSAYGFQGQKCSACSRLIAFDEIHDRLVDLVVERAAALSIGPPRENHPVGPVISATQRGNILAEIEAGKSQATLVLGGRPIDRDGGYYLEPTIFVDVDPDDRLAQHEIFGPVLSVLRVRDLDEALAVANGTEYGLTGGFYSTDEARIERVEREFYVGNLYINRKITGALVGVQPFGGFNMSGSNAKAGGPDYLRLFMEMKSVARRLDGRGSEGTATSG
ncbi:MAG TPA: L-glutamate gamma-semialdehyde dehydrogenase [Actinobacteria bacterium]|nr:L-glutamate gamma-semialdehyde dehydrogenase [Actinomycetota bacterium]